MYAKAKTDRIRVRIMFWVENYLLCGFLAKALLREKYLELTYIFDYTFTVKISHELVFTYLVLE